MVVFFLLCLLALAGAPLGMWSSYFERLTHFRFYWIGILSALGLWWGLRRSWRWLAATLVLLGWSVGGLLPYYQTPPPLPTLTSAPLTFISFNLLSRNPLRHEALAWLEDQTADVVLLREYNLHWQRAFAGRAKAWPHRLEYVRPGTSGICLLSRHPMDPADPAGIAETEIHPWISTIVHAPGGDIQVLGMHPRTPRGGIRFDQRNIQLETAGRLAAASQRPFVLLGDLNCTPFSPWFTRLLEKGNLKDSARGFGLPPTWHHTVWWLPIDHVLISPHWHVRHRRVYTGELGSDHRPLLTVLAREDA